MQSAWQILVSSDKQSMEGEKGTFWDSGKVTSGETVQIPYNGKALQSGTRSSEIIASDETWKTSEGPTVRNNIYLGEWYDARLEIPGWNTPSFDDSKWANGTKTGGPAGKLTWQYIPPIRHTRTLIPVRILDCIGDQRQLFICLFLKIRDLTFTKGILHWL